MGYWATAIGYVASIFLGTGLFMNWYYQTRIGLDMFYFWRRQAPTILMSLAVIAVCLLGSRFFLPVDSIPTFLLWGVIYVVLFGVAALRFSLTGQERSRVVDMMKRKVIRK